MYKYLAILLATFLVLSCEQSPTSGKDEPKTKSEILPRSNGSHAEMLALVSDEWFVGKTGEQVLKILKMKNSKTKNLKKVTTKKFSSKKGKVNLWIWGLS